MSLGAFASTALGSPLDPRSAQARAISDLFTTTLFICSAILLLVTGLVAYCIYRFRDKGDGVEPVQIEGHTRLELAWTIAPTLVLVWLLFLTVRAMNASDPPVTREPDVIIIGHQWWWEVRYPSGAVTANEIHIPIGKPLVVRVESADVIHDFWVPQLGRKIDAIPGRPASIWLSADEEGTYLGACAEYCGVQHAWMRIMVVAETPEKFAAWERHEISSPPAPTTAEATRGAKLFREMTCVKCHSITGVGDKPTVAPDLTHLAARRTLGAGVLDNTPADLARWLKDPQEIKAGCHMPDTQLTDAQVRDLVSYFETLR